MNSSDFPPGTKFFDVDDIPVAEAPGKDPVGLFASLNPRPVSEKTALKLAYEAEISAEEFDELISRSFAWVKANSAAAE